MNGKISLRRSTFFVLPPFPVVKKIRLMKLVLSIQKRVIEHKLTKLKNELNSLED